MMIVTLNYDKDDSLSPMYTATPLAMGGGGGGIGQIKTNENSQTQKIYPCMVHMLLQPITHR